MNQWRKPTPVVGDVWTDITGYHGVTGRRIRILELIGTAGVRAHVLTSVHPDREVLLPIKTLHHDYDREATA